MEDTVSIEELSNKAIADVKDSATVLDGVKSVKAAMAAEPNFIKKILAGVKAGVALITDVISHVEVVGTDLKLAGSSKRDLAVTIINKLIDVPYVPEALEAMVIGFAVDTIVNAFNAKFGKAWLTKVPV